MKISILWRSASVTPDRLLPDFETLISKPFSAFSDILSFVSEDKDYNWHSVTFKVPHIMIGICVSDNVLLLLRREGVENVIRSFKGEGAYELNYLLSRLDVVEEAVREAVVAIKRTRSFDMVPYLGKRLKEIRLRLEKRISYQRNGLPI